MKTLLIDIETTPNLGHVWDLWNQNIGLSQLVESTEMLCFAYKWLGERGDEFTRADDMVQTAHALLDEADVVMHYNGKRFDVPHLNREFLTHGLLPPSPYQQIDLYRAVKSAFNFPSYKLEYVSRALGLKGKVDTGGFELWLGCMSGDEKAWRLMEKYNRQDVRLLEQVYKHLRPWIPQHPSHAAMSLTHVCPTCGSSDLQKRGWKYTEVSKFQQYRCNNCGAWSRDTRRVAGATLRAVAA